MQITLNELHHLENAIPSQALPTNFQLPTLQDVIPRRAAHLRYHTDFTGLGQQLLAAGILDPATVSPDAITPKQVVEEGLGAWFMRRIGRLQHMRFDVAVVDAEHANAYVRDGEWNDIMSFDNAALAISGDVAEMRFVEDIARLVEAKVPQLFLTAFTELVEAGYRTIDLHHPERILEMEAAYSLWGNDLSSVDDDEARESLIERYGEDDAVIEGYMPDAMIEAFGNGFCFNNTRKGKPHKKRRSFPDLKLKKLAKDEDPMIAGIASGLLGLRRARQRAHDLDAFMNSVEEQGARPLWTGCILLFNGHGGATEFMDDEHQHLMESGEGTELFAIEQLPATAAALKTRFQQLDALLDLIAQMDALIPTISYPTNAE